MSVSAYVLVQTMVGKSAQVTKRIREQPGVVIAQDVTGPYDVIVQIEAETVDQLGALVVNGIQNTDGIMRTVTCPVVNI